MADHERREDEKCKTTEAGDLGSERPPATARRFTGRPRERLLDLGAAALSDAELVALLLGTGVAGRPALECAQGLLARVGGVEGLSRAEVGELATLPAVGLARAARLRAAVELGRRAAGAQFTRGESIGSPEDVRRRLSATFAGETQEVFVALGLDTKHRVLLQCEVARGTLTSVEVHPREVLRRLVRESAAAFIVAHNHPSGDPSPSPEDIRLTDRLVAAGELVGITLLDHVIVGQGAATFSFAESTPLLRREATSHSRSVAPPFGRLGRPSLQPPPVRAHAAPWSGAAAKVAGLSTSRS